MRVRDSQVGGGSNTHRFFVAVVVCMIGLSCREPPTSPSASRAAIEIIDVAGQSGETRSFAVPVRVTIETNINSDLATLQILPNGGVLPIYLTVFVCVSVDGQRFAAHCVRASTRANQASMVDAPGLLAGSSLSRTDAIVAFVVNSEDDRRYDMGDSVPATALATDVRPFIVFWR